MKIFYRSLIFLFVFLVEFSAKANIKLPVIFQSNMVLQRDKEVKIWGFGDKGEKVFVTIGDQKFSATTGKDGKWMIALPPHKAGGPYTILISGNKNSIELKNVLFGDVWICAGQSNMQFTVDQTTFPIADSLKNPQIRIFTASIGMDYVPANDLSGGKWQEASANTIKNFSAVAYFFGKFLEDSLQIPIGLISDNLGATSVETWMSNESLSGFPQFQHYYQEYLKPGKSFEEITAEFEKIKPRWEKDYYLKGKGLEEKWYLPETDISDWKTMEIPNWWEDKGLGDFDGAVWFRKSFDLPENFKADSFPLALNQIDDYDIVWVNGQKVGEGFGNQNWRNYKVAANILKPKNNVIVVRVFDAGGKGGMYSGAIWGNPVLLGNWLYKPGYKIDAATFPKPHVVNVSPFSTPAVLFNANIAPITSLSIKGVIWYQGESNASRAEEYAQLFPAMIKDWRTHFGQGNIPFLFVQLANYMEEAKAPQESDWAELREAQKAALKLPNTGMAVAIDIGEANDIHPKNKMEVGKRLGLAALKIAYQKDIVADGPVYESIDIKNDSVIVHFKSGTNHLITKDKYGYVRGFAIAGNDKIFHWAKAFVRNNTVVVYSQKVNDPVAVRYAWSDNPGETDLYNNAGLPAVPFRTDDWPLKTSGKKFSENPWDF
jgi:sialate O-acetylesterase